MNAMIPFVLQIVTHYAILTTVHTLVHRGASVMKTQNAKSSVMSAQILQLNVRSVNSSVMSHMETVVHVR